MIFTLVILSYQIFFSLGLLLHCRLLNLLLTNKKKKTFQDKNCFVIEYETKRNSRNILVCDIAVLFLYQLHSGSKEAQYTKLRKISFVCVYCCKLRFVQDETRSFLFTYLLFNSRKLNNLYCKLSLVMFFKYILNVLKLYRQCFKL